MAQKGKARQDQQPEPEPEHPVMIAMDYTVLMAKIRELAGKNAELEVMNGQLTSTLQQAQTQLRNIQRAAAEAEAQDAAEAATDQGEAGDGAPAELAEPTPIPNRAARRRAAKA